MDEDTVLEKLNTVMGAKRVALMVSPLAFTSGASDSRGCP